MNSKRIKAFTLNKSFTYSIGFHLLIILAICGYFLKFQTDYMEPKSIKINLVSQKLVNEKLSEDIPKDVTLTAPKSVTAEPEKIAVANGSATNSKAALEDLLEALPDTKSQDVRIEGNQAKDKSSNNGSHSNSEDSKGNPQGKDKLTNGAGDGLEGIAGIVKNGDGSYTVMDSSIIDYHILREAKLFYPQQALDLGYNKVVVVKAQLLVGLNGRVENVKIINSVPNLGFREEAKKALYNMKFSPVYKNGINVKFYFAKNVVFTP